MFIAHMCPQSSDLQGSAYTTLQTSKIALLAMFLFWLHQVDFLVSGWPLYLSTPTEVSPISKIQAVSFDVVRNFFHWQKRYILGQFFFLGAIQNFICAFWSWGDFSTSLSLRWASHSFFGVEMEANFWQNHDRIRGSVSFLKYEDFEPQKAALAWVEEDLDHLFLERWAQLGWGDFWGFDWPIGIWHG